MADGYLCVGGPYDGKWIACEGSVLRVAVVTTSPQWAGDSTEIPTIKTVLYHQKILDFPEKICLWVPEDQTDSETIKSLIHRYRPRRDL